MNSAEITNVGPGVRERLGFLPLFARFGPADLSAMFGSAQLKRLDEGDVLLTKGEPADRFFVLVEGHVGIYTDRLDDREQLVDILPVGALPGLADMLTGVEVTHTVRAVDPAMVIEVPAEPFLTVLAANFDWQRALMGGLSVRLHTLVKQISGLKLKSSGQRLAQHLLDLAAQNTDHGRFRLPCEKKLLASHLGMTPESFSRSLAKLREQGATIHGDEVRITDRQRLAAFAEGWAGHDCATFCEKGRNL